MNQLMQMMMIAMMAGLSKTMMLQSSDHDIVEDLRSSIIEESRAAADYHVRGEWAKTSGLSWLADVYEHIEKEEEEHRLELLEALKKYQSSIGCSR